MAFRILASLLLLSCAAALDDQSALLQMSVGQEPKPLKISVKKLEEAIPKLIVVGQKLAETFGFDLPMDKLNMVKSFAPMVGPMVADSEGNVDMKKLEGFAKPMISMATSMGPEKIAEMASDMAGIELDDLDLAVIKTLKNVDMSMVRDLASKAMVMLPAALPMATEMMDKAGKNKMDMSNMPALVQPMLKMAMTMNVDTIVEMAAKKMDVELDDLDRTVLAKLKSIDFAKYMGAANKAMAVFPDALPMVTEMVNALPKEEEHNARMLKATSKSARTVGELFDKVASAASQKTGIELDELDHQVLAHLEKIDITLDQVTHLVASMMGVDLDEYDTEIFDKLKKIDVNMINELVAKSKKQARRHEFRMMRRLQGGEAAATYAVTGTMSTADLMDISAAALSDAMDVELDERDHMLLAQLEKFDVKIDDIIKMVEDKTNLQLDAVGHQMIDRFLSIWSNKNVQANALTRPVSRVFMETDAGSEVQRSRHQARILKAVAAGSSAQKVGDVADRIYHLVSEKTGVELNDFGHEMLMQLEQLDVTVDKIAEYVLELADADTFTGVDEVDQAALHTVKSIGTEPRILTKSTELLELVEKNSHQRRMAQAAAGGGSVEKVGDVADRIVAKVEQKMDVYLNEFGHSVLTEVEKSQYTVDDVAATLAALMDVELDDYDHALLAKLKSIGSEKPSTQKYRVLMAHEAVKSAHGAANVHRRKMDRSTSTGKAAKTVADVVDRIAHIVENKMDVELNEFGHLVLAQLNKIDLSVDEVVKMVEEKTNTELNEFGHQVINEVKNIGK